MFYPPARRFVDLRKADDRRQRRSRLWRVIAPTSRLKTCGAERMSRPQRNTKRPKWQEEEEEEDSRQKGRGGKLPAKRDEKKGELVSPQSAKGESPAAGDERRPKHFGDEAGGTALPIPSKSLNVESPGTAASKGTASSKHESEESAEEGEDEDGIEGEEDKEEEAAGAETDGEETININTHTHPHTFLRTTALRARVWQMK